MNLGYADRDIRNGYALDRFGARRLEPQRRRRCPCPLISVACHMRSNGCHIGLAQQAMTPRDYAALTPLIWSHVNPYGRFDLDMNARMALA